MPEQGSKGLWDDRVLLWALALVAVLSVAFAGRVNALPFDPEALTNLGDVLAPLVIVSAFIERAVEVILTPLRGDAAESLRAKIEKAEEAKKDSSDLKDELRDHQHKSRRAAFVLAVAFGLMSSLAGFRGISNLLADPMAVPEPMMMLDVGLTGLVLGGGAEGIHKIVKVFTTYMELITQKNEEKKRSSATPQP